MMMSGITERRRDHHIQGFSHFDFQKRTSTMAANVPNTTDKQALKKPSLILRKAAPEAGEFSISSAYHFAEPRPDGDQSGSR